MFLKPTYFFKDGRHIAYVNMINPIETGLQEYLDTEEFIGSLKQGKICIAMLGGIAYRDYTMDAITRLKQYTIVDAANICATVRRIYVADNGGDNQTICIEFELTGPKGEWFQKLINADDVYINFQLRALYENDISSGPKIRSVIAVDAIINPVLY